MGKDDSLAPRSLRIPAALDGERLDRALVTLLSGVSRVRLQELIRDGGVVVQGDVVRRQSHAVEAGQEIRLREVPRSRERTGGGEESFLVLHEDDALAVIDKPPGMVVHPSQIVRGGTVAERAVALWGALPTVQGEDRPGIVHRLDADTSGVMLIAKNDAAATTLVRAFREREVEKEYEALVFGETRFDSDWIDAPIGRRPGRPDRMSVMQDGREAATFYETLERFRGFSSVLCRPRTGRTHQIRVHLTHIGHPLVGDRVYKGRSSFQLPAGAPRLRRHALHARSLAFRHPTTGAQVRFETPPPADMRALVEWLRATRAL